MRLYARQAGRATVPSRASRQRARRRPDLLGAGVPRRDVCSSGPAAARVDGGHEGLRADGRTTIDLNCPTAKTARSYLAVAQPSSSRRQPLRRARRREADVAAAQPLGDARRAARHRLRRRHHRRGAARRSISRGASRSRCASSRSRPTRSRPVTTASSCRARRARTRSRISRRGSRTWRRSSPSRSSCRATS